MIDPRDLPQSLHLLFCLLRILKIPILNSIQIFTLLMQGIHAKLGQLREIGRRKGYHPITFRECSRGYPRNGTRISRGAHMITKTRIDGGLFYQVTMIK
jgi:hypothetical protein